MCRRCVKIHLEMIFGERYAYQHIRISDRISELGSYFQFFPVNFQISSIAYLAILRLWNALSFLIKVFKLHLHLNLRCKDAKISSSRISLNHHKLSKFLLQKYENTKLLRHLRTNVTLTDLLFTTIMQVLPLTFGLLKASIF